ncbi:MAG: hypothetical protein ACFFAN_04360 [Promethearchaeota archaeon]
MSKEEKEKKKANGLGLSEEKILYGDKLTVCFACGQKIEILTEKCPYCGTKQ